MAKALRALSALAVLLLSLLGLMLVIPPLLGLQALVAAGSSMEPGIRAGDLVYIQPSVPGEIAVGDVITFRLPGELPATHRVIGIRQEEQLFLTRGDANRSADAPIPFDRLMGRVVFSLPRAGRLAASLKAGYAIPVAVGALLLAALRALPVVIGKKNPSPKRSSPDIRD